MAASRVDNAKRINVAVNEQMLAAFDFLCDRENVTLTEAVRRLTQYGDFVYRAVREDGCALILRSSNGDEKEVVLL